MKQHILSQKLEALFQQATIGIEREGQRVDNQAHVQRTPHPTAFGHRSFHPYIQTDFAESQLELITPACETEKQAYRFLSAIHEVTYRQLPDTEYIWPLSMPGVLPQDDDILEAQMTPGDTAYREYLSQKYGKSKQMVSGIHYNFGFSQAFLSALAQENESLVDVKNRVYMKVARQFIRYQWILVYLFGAAPTVDSHYFGTDTPPQLPVRSIRSSRFGYVNEPHVHVSFESVADYVKDITDYVENGEFIAEKEFYSSVRLKGSPKVADFLYKGIGYLEFRLFDLNPFAPYGITLEDMRFVHLFILLMLWLDEEDMTQSVMVGKQYSENIALAHPLEKPVYSQEGHWVMDALVDMAQALQLPESDMALIREKKAQLDNPIETVGGRLHMLYSQSDALNHLVEQAVVYKRLATDKPFGLTAFANMELSTQAFLSDVIQKGIHVEILDEHDQFLKLSHNNHVEYVKNGNMTSKDSYISPLIMENKVVTKKVLADNGFRVPHSYQCQSVEEATRLFSLVSGQPIVVKPKSTNYGLGISIFQDGTTDLADFQTAITLALKEDKEVMIEEFIKGTEYRFFVLEDKTLAVLERVPANVVGDGVSTVAQLIARKNDSILRGDGKTTPLKKIELGPIEQLQLKEQGYTSDSVIPLDETVYLRANSNISTGGDSIDRTDDMHSSYKEIAVGIAKAMHATICGVDLIVPDMTIPAQTHSDTYGIIEANFNPMMMMHIFPAVGTSRRLTMSVLEVLFPELNEIM